MCNSNYWLLSNDNDLISLSYPFIPSSMQTVHASNFRLPHNRPNWRVFCISLNLPVCKKCFLPVMPIRETLIHSLGK